MTATMSAPLRNRKTKRAGTVSLRGIALSAEAFHDVPFEELPRRKNKAPEDLEQEAREYLSQLEGLGLISREENEALLRCIELIRTDDLAGVKSVRDGLEKNARSSPVALAIAGVAASSLKNARRLGGSQSRQVRRLGRGGAIALWDLLGAASGAALGFGIGGAAGAVAGGIIVGTAFSVGAAYDMGAL
jgi:hypothetical protein